MKNLILDCLTLTMNSVAEFHKHLFSEYRAGKWKGGKYTLRSDNGFFLPHYPAEYLGYAVTAIYVKPEITNFVIQNSDRTFVLWREKSPQIETETELEAILEESQNIKLNDKELSNYKRITPFTPFIYRPAGGCITIESIIDDYYIEYFIVPKYETRFNTGYPTRNAMSADSLDSELGAKMFYIDHIHKFQYEPILEDVSRLVSVLNRQLSNMNIDELELLDRLDWEEYKIN